MISREKMKFQGDTNPPILAGNLLFLANIVGLSFSLNILPDFETLPSQRKIMLSLFNQSFLARFIAIFLWFLSHFYPFGIWAWAYNNFRCRNAFLTLEYLYAKSWSWKQAWKQNILDRVCPLRTLEMMFQNIKISKFSGGACFQSLWWLVPLVSVWFISAD